VSIKLIEKFLLRKTSDDFSLNSFIYRKLEFKKFQLNPDDDDDHMFSY
jgi:hypothetical protein